MKAEYGKLVEQLEKEAAIYESQNLGWADFEIDTEDVTRLRDAAQAIRQLSTELEVADDIIEGFVTRSRWCSADKDNMEFDVRVTTFLKETARAFLTRKEKDA